MISNKYDFLVVISASKTNPNGDPLNGNRPREDYNGFGEISDVCLKRKIRNRLQDMGENIFVQTNEKCNDGYKSLEARAKAFLSEEINNRELINLEKKACEQWIDVRSFGQIFPFDGKSKKKDSDKSDSKGISVGIRGPVSIHPAFSVDPIEIEEIQITKSVNLKTTDDGGKDSSTMGMKYRTNFGLYVTKGSINVQLAEKTGFSDEDAEKIHNALITLFENDASSTRPEGSMAVERVYWWKHNSKIGDYPTVKVHKSVNITLKEGVLNPKSVDDYEINVTELEGLKPEIYEL